MIMDPLQLHLLVNHLPIIGALTALIVVVIGVIRKDATIRTVGLSVYAVMALAVLPTYFSGEGAEERIENIAGISHDVIHEHEESAELSLTVMLIAAAVALATLLTQWKGMSIAQPLTYLFVVIALMATLQIARTGHEGGKIRRPDLGSAAPSQHIDND